MKEGVGEGPPTYGGGYGYGVHLLTAVATATESAYLRWWLRRQ